MLRIERLRLHLPPGYEARAADIAQHVGELLARADVSGLRSKDSVIVPRLAIDSHASDRDVATAVTHAITAQLGAKR